MKELDKFMDDKLKGRQLGIFADYLQNFPLDMSAPCCWKWTLEWWPHLSVHLRVDYYSKLQVLPSATLPWLDHLCDFLSSLTPSLFLPLLPFLKACYSLKLLSLLSINFTIFFSVDAFQISISSSVNLHPGTHFQLPMEISPFEYPACTSNSRKSQCQRVWVQ